MVRTFVRAWFAARGSFAFLIFAAFLAGGSVKGQFRHLCPTNFSLSRRYDKLKLIGHQTDPLLADRFD